MSVGTIVYIMRDGIFQTLILAAPLLVIALVIGLVISIIQATTSIQEQTLTFVPKITAILLTLVYLAPWMLTSLAEFTRKIFELIPDIVK